MTIDWSSREPPVSGNEARRSRKRATRSWCQVTTASYISRLERRELQLVTPSSSSVFPEVSFQ